jgi:leucyl-tRNA---protein transferase
MNKYLKWDEETITDFSEENINTMYHRGFIFVRPKNGFMQQTRSIRIDLNKFELSSENRRILRKTDELKLEIEHLPLENYNWEIGKLGKNFYKTKFGDGTFSANKVKELMTSGREDFNQLLIYTSLRGAQSDVAISSRQKIATPPPSARNDSVAVGYCIAVETNKILHYSYPFYNLQSPISNLGMGMMIRAVKYAKESGKQYIYLGSFQRPSDTYKLQFSGMEWFDGEGWQSDLDELKKI